MSNSAYSDLKAAWHLEKIDDLREGRQIVPAQVQLIISDLCNQDCIGEGTLIDSPSGPIPIERLIPGDFVTGPDGVPVKVIGTAWKVTNDLHEVKVGNRTLYATGEHKLLTQEGWKAIRDLSGGDRTAVRLRMRRQSFMESTPKEMGSLHLRARQRGDKNTLCQEGAGLASSASWRNRSAMPMRMRETSEDTSSWGRSLLGGLSARTSEHRQAKYDVGSRSSEQLGSNEGKQPYATAWSCRTGETIEVYGNLAIKTGTKVRCLCDLAQSPDSVRWGRDVLGSTEKSRLQSEGAVEGHRGYNSRDLQRMEDRTSHRGELRLASDRTLRARKASLSSGVLSSGQPKTASRGAGRRDSRICIEGISLERGLGFRRVDSVRRVEGRFKVYDISCPPVSSFVANGITASNCHFCSYRISGGFSTEQFADANGNKNPNRKIPTLKAMEILEDCQILGVKAIQFTGGGEPTVHPDHLDLFRYAQDLGLETSLVTNGVRFMEGWEQVLPKMKWVRVSIDAGRAEEYAAVRRVKPEFYEKALGNVTSLASQIDTQGTDCLLGVGYVITMENWQDLYDGVLRIRDTGAAYVRLSAMFSEQGAGYYDDAMPDIREQIERVMDLQTCSFRVVNLFGDRISDLVQHAPDYEFCGYQQFNMYIGGNLRVYRCCTTAYTKHGEVGDLTNQRFAQWFYSQSKSEAYAKFDAKTCHTCQFNGKNRAINYLTGEIPLHVNFV